MIFVSFNGNTTGGAANPSGTPSVLSGGRVAQSFDKYSVNYVQMTTDGIDIRFWFKVDD
jgi:hypothetical protein